MRRCSDVSFWSHFGWDIVDHIETSSQRRYWYVNDTDLFGTLSRRLIGTLIRPTNLRRYSDVPTVIQMELTNLRRRKDVATGT